MSDLDGGTLSGDFDGSESIDDETIPDELGGESEELTDDVELTDEEPELDDESDEDADADEEDRKNEAKRQSSDKDKKKVKTVPKLESQKKPPRELGDDDQDAIVTVKINGETKKMTVRELVKVQQLAQASHQKMQEAAEERRKAQQLFEFAKSNPIGFRKMVGLRDEDFDKEAEERLARKYELASMTPEERELHELRLEKQGREKNELQSKQSLLDAIENEVGQKVPDELKRLPPERLQAILENAKVQTQKAQGDLDEQIGGAWKDSGLPKHPRFVQLIAQSMRNHLQRTGEPLQAKDAAAIVKRDFTQHVKEILSSMDAPAIQEMLGDDTIKKLRSHDVQRVTGKKPISHEQQPRRPATAASTPRTKEMSPHEARAYMASLKKQLRD